MLLCENVVFYIYWANYIYIVTHQLRVYQHSKVSIRYPCIEIYLFIYFDKLGRSRYPIIYPILG
jgi:hypothetical protein